MDGLIQAVLSGNIFIQTQCLQKVIELCIGVRFKPGLLCLLSSKEFHESELQRNSPWTSLRPETVLSWKDSEEPAE